MEELDIVDEYDQIIGKASYEEIHSKGLRHRSVQIFVFDKFDLKNLLVSQRSQKQEVSKLKFHPSAAGHLKLGQSYLEAALDELKEELFYEIEKLPEGIKPIEIARYKNDTRPTNKENTSLFYVVYSGPFSPDPKEIEKVFWDNPSKIRQNMLLNPSKYTRSFLNAMREFENSLPVK
jgi:isopentenyldiphosphate isomerase